METCETCGVRTENLERHIELSKIYGKECKRSDYLNEIKDFIEISFNLVYYFCLFIYDMREDIIKSLKRID